MTDAPVTVGDILAGKYRVERVLGIGGMGVVVQATHVQLEERVALKFMLPEAAQNADVAGRFLREARLAVKLRSEHVAKVMDVGTLENGSPYIVMEYLDGTDLNQLLEKHGPLPFADVAEYVIQACDAVAEAHSLGIVHRDLKPANLFLARRPDGAPLVKVLDFGISKANALSEGSGSVTKTSTMMGSPYFMSPEQMRSAKDVDARSDVWSVGVILYQLLTARLPFESDTLGGIMAQVLTDDPAQLTVYRPDVPHAFQAVVARCIQRDRNARAQNVGEVVMMLAPYAPARARPIAERISGLLGSARGTGTVIGTVPEEVRSSVPSFPPTPAGVQVIGAAPPPGSISVSGITGAPSPRKSSSLGLAAAGVIGVAAIAGLAWYFGARGSAAPPAPVAAATPTPSQTVAATSQAAPPPTASAAPAPAPATAVVTAPTASATVAAASAPESKRVEGRRPPPPGRPAAAPKGGGMLDDRN